MNGKVSPHRLVSLIAPHPYLWCINRWRCKLKTTRLLVPRAGSLRFDIYISHNAFDSYLRNECIINRDRKLDAGIYRTAGEIESPAKRSGNSALRRRDALKTRKAATIETRIYWRIPPAKVLAMWIWRWRLFNFFDVGYSLFRLRAG